MLTSEALKEAAKRCGADLCGIGSMDRFEGAPKQQDPRYIFPAARACVTLGFRIPRGYYRGVEEGTYFAAYPALGYAGLNKQYMPIVLQQLCSFIEDHGYEAAPVPNAYPGTSVRFDTQAFDPTRSRPVREGYPHPDVLVDFRVAAFVCGLGEFGYSKVFLTPQFGPRQRFVSILTDAPLGPDPIYEGPPLCDRCMQCAKECSAGAISTTETESIMVAGRKVEWGKFDCRKCSIGYWAAKPEYNPFMQPGTDPEAYAATYAGRPGLGEKVTYPHVDGLNPALEGARGCVRACFIHLEKRGVLSNRFENPFRTRPPWRLASDAEDDQA